jgi:uncharacterized protein (TIGR02145 family)
MRKIVCFAMFFLLSTTMLLNDIIAQATTLAPAENTPIRVRGCNTDSPGWGQNLGIVSFVTDSTWKISNGIITQIWSDAVQATNCNKIMFDGGDFRSLNFKADCRSNPNYKGDLFSWCAVMRFAKQLCPDPWRVPTQQDFIDLDRAMGGTGHNQISFLQLTRYVGTGNNQWGGVYGGYCRLNSMIISEGSWAHYWSSSEGDNVRSARNLNFGVNGVVYPRNNGENSKNAGFSLRCVR